MCIYTHRHTYRHVIFFIFKKQNYQRKLHSNLCGLNRTKVLNIFQKDLYAKIAKAFCFLLYIFKDLFILCVLNVLPTRTYGFPVYTWCLLEAEREHRSYKLPCWCWEPVACRDCTCSRPRRGGGRAMGERWVCAM